jgi:membrane fusion protein (multidrug efflux system)
MPATFSQTLRSLEETSRRRTAGRVLVAALLLGWTAWFLFGSVAVYETSDQARVEVACAAHAVAATVEGRVVETRLSIGREVASGEVLMVLDAEAPRRALAEKRVRHAGLNARLQALRGETAAEQDALRAQRRARAADGAAVRAQIAEAEAQARFAQYQSDVTVRLLGQGAASETEYRKGRLDAEARWAAVWALTRGLERLEQDRTAQESERQARIARLEREAVGLRAEAATEEAAVRRLEYEVEQRTVRAPVAGRVGEAAEVRVGSVVRAAERLGTVVPPGEPRAVALFPAAAVGRLRPGQPARLRLHGFPWTRYGTLAATVADAGNEARDGRVRVEFDLPSDPSSPIPREHGLPGSVEVEVERLSPAALALRAAGQWLTGLEVPRATPEKPEP